MKTLNPREQYIIQKRRLSENAATLEELGSEFGISRERVRQVEFKAFEKLQKNIKTQLLESND
jgi:RNA polymerase sigma-32 factor